MKNIFLILFVLIFSGCQTTTSVNLIPQVNQKTSYSDGQEAIKSILPNSIVILSSAFTEVKNGKRIDVIINVNNTSNNTFLLDTSSIEISTPNIGTLKVFSYDELVAEQKQKAKTAAILTAFAGAVNTMAASYSGYQTTTGTFNANTYGAYNTNTYGNYTATTYNSAAAQQAINEANNRTTANLQNIQRTSSASLKNLKNSILKKTTMEPGMWYGGVARFDAPKLEKDENRFYTLKIKLGDDVHQFELAQQIIKK